MKEIENSLKILGLKSEEVEYISEFNMIRHKFYVGFLVNDKTIGGLIKEGIDYKKLRAFKALEKNDCDSYVFSHCRPFRLEAFLEFKQIKNLKKSEAETFANLWIDCENPYINLSIWKGLFKEYGKISMTNYEMEVYENLGDFVEVYRGVQNNSVKDKGISWTLNIEKAKWFANRFNGDGIIKTKIVRKKSIVCYYNDRGEDEVIILN